MISRGIEVFNWLKFIIGLNSRNIRSKIRRRSLNALPTGKVNDYTCNSTFSFKIVLTNQISMGYSVRFSCTEITHFRIDSLKSQNYIQSHKTRGR